MEEENNKRETRRSRSKTPLTLRASVDGDVETDGEKKKVKKNPTVETITEESPAPVVTQRSTRTKRNAAKLANIDASAAETNASVNKETISLIANSVAVVPQAIVATEQTVTKTTTFITSKSVKTSSGENVLSEKQQQQQSQTVTKSTAASTRARDALQNESNFLLELNAKLKTSTPRANKADRDISNSNINTSNNINDSLSLDNSSITNGVNLEDHAAYKEYKEAGEYWNKFPKTDYTYSKLSQQRREVKPGIIAMPNMSRRSLDLHQKRVNNMVSLDPAQESFFRSRYTSQSTALGNRYAVNSYYDSGDETDHTFGLNGGRQQNQSLSIFQRFFSWINVIVSSIYYYRFTGLKRHEQINAYYAQCGAPKKGIFGRIWSSILTTIYSVFCYIYLGIASVLILDSILVRKETLPPCDHSRRKKYLIGLLIFLPLLLLAGAYFYLEKSVPIPNISIDDYIDPKWLNALKIQGDRHYNQVLNVTSDYWLYFKATAQNSVVEVKKLWSENFPY